MTAPPDLDRVEIREEGALWAWLDTHHARDASVLLVTYKKAAGARYVSRDAVLDALIAYGWIDGRRWVHEDPTRTMQLISPRKQQVWAQSYKSRAKRLEDEGKLRAPGRAAIDRAKAAGQWDAGTDVDALVVPDDLRSALAQAPDAATWFDQAAPSYKRNVLRWLKSAKRQPTRDKRIMEIVTRASKGEKVPQY